MSEEIRKPEKVSEASYRVVFLQRSMKSASRDISVSLDVHTLDSSSRLCFLPNTLFRSCVASERFFRPSAGVESPIMLLAVVLGLVSESWRYRLICVDSMGIHMALGRAYGVVGSILVHLIDFVLAHG